MNKYNPVYQITDWYDTKKIELYQYNKLIKLANHAYDNIPYYRRILMNMGYVRCYKCTKDIESIPILTKKDIINNSSDLIDRRPKIYKKTFKINTSGSTGNPLTIFKDINKSIAFLYYRYLYNIGYRFRDKQISLWVAGIKVVLSKKLKIY